VRNTLSGGDRRAVQVIHKLYRILLDNHVTTRRRGCYKGRQGKIGVGTLG
jgi:hypothetical protein